MNPPPVHRPKLVSRSVLRAELRKATLAAVSPRTLDRVEAELEERFREIVERAVAGRDREVGLWRAQGAPDRSPRLEARHIEPYTNPVYSKAGTFPKEKRNHEQNQEVG